MTETDFGKNPVESLTSSENWFLKEWRENNDSGLTNFILVTADRFQRGKTSCAMRLAEVIEEELGIPFPMEWSEDKPTDFTGSNLGFDPLWYLERMEKVPEFSILLGDEWQRAMKARRWWEPIQQEFAEILEATAFEHKHGIFTLPRQKKMDNAIAEDCTAHIIIEAEKGRATVYSYNWDQLNRVTKARTPRVGELVYKKPSAKRWHIFQKMRAAYTNARRTKLKERIKMAMEMTLEQEAAESVKQDDLLQIILDDKSNYIGKSGKVSAIKIIARNKGLSWAKAQVLASLANDNIHSS